MQIAAACDENTIGVAAILGTTYTGAFDDVAGVDAAISCAKFRHCALHEHKKCLLPSEQRGPPYSAFAKHGIDCSRPQHAV